MLFLKNACATGRLEHCDLCAVVLILGGNTGVANMHLEVFFKGMGSTYKPVAIRLSYAIYLRNSCSPVGFEHCNHTCAKDRLRTSITRNP